MAGKKFPGLPLVFDVLGCCRVFVVDFLRPAQGLGILAQRIESNSGFVPLWYYVWLNPLLRYVTSMPLYPVSIYTART
jgi:hypothetical protein